MAARIEAVVTSGTFSLDGGSREVDNNVWLVGDDHEVLVVDAAYDAQPILAAVAGRRSSPSRAPTGTTTRSRGPLAVTRVSAGWLLHGFLRCIARMAP